MPSSSSPPVLVICLTQGRPATRADGWGRGFLLELEETRESAGALVVLLKEGNHYRSVVLNVQILQVKP